MNDSFAHFEVCFAAGTRVLMADGTSKAIETICAGERVLSVSESEPDGAVVTREVVRVFHNNPQPLQELSINGHPLHATPNHPFHVSNVGWISASSLEPGMCFRTPNGHIARLDKTTTLPEPVPVYNLQIADTHTYFVQPHGSDTAVLVHNESPSSPSSPSSLSMIVLMEDGGVRNISRNIDPEVLEQMRKAKDGGTPVVRTMHYPGVPVQGLESLNLTPSEQLQKDRSGSGSGSVVVDFMEEEVLVLGQGTVNMGQAGTNLFLHTHNWVVWGYQGIIEAANIPLQQGDFGVEIPSPSYVDVPDWSHRLVWKD